MHIPFLYARKVNSKPFNALTELAKTYSDTTNWSESDHAYDYLTYVQTDDTEESYFQHAVLRIMGGQFYLWWHAAYNDHTVICNSSGLEKLFAKNGSPFSVPAEIQGKAQLLDLAPKIELDKATATVRVVIFTSWGGFIEETYTISRASPHMIQDIKTKTLVKWNVNVTF